jgi:hypothetical protein
MKRFMMLGIIALFSIAMLVGRAEAVPVTGDITFGGTLLSTLDLGTTTVVNFEPQTALVTSVAGGLDSTGIDVGSLATFRDFQFSPFVPNNPLWTTGGFSFNLTSVAVSAQTPVTLGLTGAGEVVGNGFDPTPYVWSFSADKSTVGGRSVVAFSATNLNDVAAIPEPSSLLLLGSGLIGLAWLRRKRNS